MGYILRLIAGATRAVIWPTPASAKIAHGLIVFGTSLLFGFSRWDEARPMLTRLGLDWLTTLSGWTFIAGGAALLALAMATRLARLTVTRIEFDRINIVQSDGLHHCDLPIRSTDFAPSPCRIVGTIKILGGAQIIYLSLLTVNRMRSLGIKPNFFGRINIDDVYKPVRLFSYNAADDEITMRHEHGTERIARNSFVIEIQVSGAGPRATHLITVTALADSIYISDGRNGHGQEIKDSH